MILFSLRRQDPHRQPQKGRKADHRYKESIKQRARHPSPGKQALILSPGRLLHQGGSVVFIRSKGQGRQGIGDQVDPQDMTGL